MGPYLDHRSDSEVCERCHRLAEGYRFAGLPAPVCVVKFIPFTHEGAGHAAYVRHCGRLRRYAGNGLSESIQHGIHHSAVVGGTLPQQPYAEVFPLETGEDRFDLIGRSAHHLVRTVVRRHADPDSGNGFVVVRHRRRHPVDRRENRRHRPFPGKGRHQRSADGGEPQPVLQRIDLRRLRGRDFSETVAEDHVRADAYACPLGGQRALQRIDRRLLPDRVVEIGWENGLGGSPGPGGPPEHRIEQRTASGLAKQRVAVVEDGPNDGFALVEFGAHPYPLTGLPGVQEGDLAGCYFTIVRSRSGIGLRKLTEAIPKRTRVPKYHARPVLEVASPHARGPCHVGKQRIGGVPGGQIFGMSVQPLHVAVCECAQRRGRFARKREKSGFARPDPARFGRMIGNRRW